jgi:hypothetical protein
MSLVDTVKQKAGEALEKGKEVVEGQQVKLHLRKLQGEEEEALAAFGNAAYTLWEQGSLSMTSDLGMAATRIRDARMAIEAKRAEIASDGDASHDDTSHDDASHGDAGDGDAGDVKP